MASTNNAVSLVAASEQDQISRMLLSWVNQFPNKPVSVINYEFLKDGEPGMALSTIQAAYKTKQYITGGYQAQYQFKVIYRVQPSTNNDRLSADETLNRLGDWVYTREDLPILGNGLIVATYFSGTGKRLTLSKPIRCQKVEATTRSSLFARYENGDEDHQILMNMIYEVI